MSRMLSSRWTLIATLGIASLVTAAPALAGTIYTDQAAFNAAVAGLTLTWDEDFQGFPPGPVADPLMIAGGAAEVVDSSSANIFDTGGGNLAWLQGGFSTQQAQIRGVGDTALSVSALSFNFGNQFTQSWEFVSNVGTDTSGSFAVTSSPSHFVGWVGDAGESLTLSRSTAAGGVILDDIGGFGPGAAVVPEPSAALLYGVGLTVVGWFLRRRPA